MTYILPPLNALRAFEAAARHLSFKLAAHELHVTPAAVGQQVKALEARLGVRLFERLHKQLILTAAGQAYLPEISDGFRRIADATVQLKPVGAVLLQLGVHGSFDLRRLDLERFRATHEEIGLRVLQPAGLHELIEGKVDALIARGLGNHPGYRCDRVTEGSGLGDWLIAPAGTADCPEISGFRDWLRGLPAENALAMHRRLVWSVSSEVEVILKQKKFGTNGPDVSVIGQGTWYLDRGDRKAAVAALRRGIETGMTHIDTAEMYGDAELVIADAIAGLPREKLFLVSKVLPSNASRRGTITACERSLKRLKTDHLDCYLLHWRGSYPFEETVAAFDELVRCRKNPLLGRQQFRL